MLAITILLASCAEEAPPAAIEPAETTETAAESTTEPLVEVTETAMDEPEPAGEEQAAPDEQAVDPPLTTAVPPTATPQRESTEQIVEPIEVTYFTPSQGEGPYYPVNKLEDRDNDLTVLQGAGDSPAGEVIEFGGRVYDVTGMPVSGVVVEIWQTDSSGVYLHPGDPGTDQRDVNFQFYGESITAADGSYSFRTILPGHYEPRPRHIHVKVRFDEQELLTTQFYFEGDPELAGESMFTQTGGDGVHLVVSLEEGQDGNGEPILVGQRDIVLNAELAN
jgi:protocatechuate 3,4-dioxygenase beta subunit